MFYNEFMLTIMVKREYLTNTKIGEQKDIIDMHR